jgi:hypothetical protein
MEPLDGNAIAGSHWRNPACSTSRPAAAIEDALELRIDSRTVGRTTFTLNVEGI